MGNLESFAAKTRGSFAFGVGPCGYRRGSRGSGGGSAGCRRSVRRDRRSLLAFGGRLAGFSLGLRGFAGSVPPFLGSSAGYLGSLTACVGSSPTRCRWSRDDASRSCAAVRDATACILVRRPRVSPRDSQPGVTRAIARQPCLSAHSRARPDRSTRTQRTHASSTGTDVRGGRRRSTRCLRSRTADPHGCSQRRTRGHPRAARSGRSRIPPSTPFPTRHNRSGETLGPARTAGLRRHHIA